MAGGMAKSDGARVAATSIDGLYLRTYPCVATYESSRDSRKKRPSHFRSGLHTQLRGAVVDGHGGPPPPCSTPTPPFRFCFSLFFPTASRKFRELRANCSKVKRTTPIMQPTVATSHDLDPPPPCQGLFILQIYYWHYVTRNYQTCLLNEFVPLFRHAYLFGL